jgi:hypothetical protein
MLCYSVLSCLWFGGRCADGGQVAQAAQVVLQREEAAV